jgi:hypothetical protein
MAHHHRVTAATTAPHLGCGVLRPCHVVAERLLTVTVVQLVGTAGSMCLPNSSPLGN